MSNLYNYKAMINSAPGLNIHMKIREICLPQENIGPAPRGVCSRPKSSLPASWVSSCKSQGRMKRSGNRPEKIHGRTQKVAGKRIKGKKYGGPLPDYSAKRRKS